MYDILIKNTKIVDGTGAPSYVGDIAIKDSKIVEMGKIEGEAATIIDGTGLVACPGFIDVHSHPDLSMQLVPQCENYIMQGITTAVGGNCGISSAPKENLSFGEYLKQLDGSALSINYIPLAGHCAIRSLVLGEDSKRLSTAEEIEGMKEYVEEAMHSGSFGFSTGRDYPPAEHASADEVIELARVARQYDGIFTTHHAHVHDHWATDDRSEVGYGTFYGETEDIWVGIYRGLLEAIDVARQADMPVHISHLANVYKFPQPHPDYLDAAGARATLEIIDSAREEGLDVTFDTLCFETSISAPKPIIDEFLYARPPGMQWIKELGRQEFLRQIGDKALRDRIKKLSRDGKLKFSMHHTKANPFWMNFFKIISCRNKDYENRTIGEIAVAENKEALDAVFDLIAEDPETMWFQTADLRLRGSIPAEFLKHDCCMPVTDMTALPPIEIPIEDILKMIPDDLDDPNIAPDMIRSALNTPNFYGVFPEYIGSLIRDKKILSLEEGIRKATSLPAWRFGLKKRGTLKSDFCADIVIFDYDKIGSAGTILNPRQKPNGIEHVIVNGEITYENKMHTGVGAGKVLRREDG